MPARRESSTQPSETNVHDASSPPAFGEASDGKRSVPTVGHHEAHRAGAARPVWPWAVRILVERALDAEADRPARHADWVGTHFGLVVRGKNLAIRKKEVARVPAAAERIARWPARHASARTQQFVGAAAAHEMVPAAVPVERIRAVVAGQAVVSPSTGDRLHVQQSVAFTDRTVRRVVAEIDRDRRCAPLVAHEV
jgi:hypothetical protein